MDNDYDSSSGTNATDQQNCDTSTTETSTTSDMYPPGEKPENRDAKIKPYVDFTEYFKNVDKRREEGTLPEGIDF